MKLEVIGLGIPEQCLRGALLVSLVSAWALVGLFYYLNCNSRHEYFKIWTGAWLCHAVWLTIGLGMGDAAPGGFLFTLNQTCVLASALLLLWGSLTCLGLPIPPLWSGAVGIFLVAWTLVSPQLMTESLQIHLPAFILLGAGTPFAWMCFLRLNKAKAFVGLGMLSLNILLWLVFVGNYPFPHASGAFYSGGLFAAALLQLFLVGRMIVLLFDNTKREARGIEAEIAAIRQEQFKLITTKEACLHLYNRMRAVEDKENAMAEVRRARLLAAEREQLEALGRMTGDVAHDLNNALTPITAYSELLLSSLPNLAELPRQRLQKISDAAEEVARIVAHLREFYRPGEAGLEAVDSDQGPKLDPDLPSTRGECRPLRILCIDDEPQLRQVLHDVLESEHHEVTVASSGEAGLELFRSRLHSGQPYEVVVTDLGMPGIDGHHVARAIKADSPRTPVIMLTGWGTMTDGQSTLDVDAVLGKPPRKQELSNLLCQITERNG